MMHALTLWQPWAWAVIHAGKDVENRFRSLGYTGEIAIHAGLHWDDEYFLDAWDDILDAGDRRLWTWTGPLTARVLYEQRGCIIGVVEIAQWRKSIEIEPSNPWESGPWCAVLRNPRALTCPVLVRGQRGIWTVPPDVEQSVLAQLGRTAAIPEEHRP